MHGTEEFRRYKIDIKACPIEIVDLSDNYFGFALKAVIAFDSDTAIGKRWNRVFSA